jgi:hypothetical protein
VTAQRLFKNLKFTSKSSTERIILKLLIDMTEDHEHSAELVDQLVAIGVVRKLCEQLLLWQQQQLPITTELV